MYSKTNFRNIFTVKNLAIIIALILTLLVAELQAQNPSTFRAGGIECTAGDGQITAETRFDVYIPSLTLSQMAYHLSQGVEAKENTNIEFGLKVLVVSYDKESKQYEFDGQQFTNVKDVRKAVKEYVIAKLGGKPLAGDKKS